MILRSLNGLLDDIVICALLMNEKDVGKEFVDCIPEALHSIYKLSLALGIRIRYTTINIILGYVRGFNELDEFDVEEIIELLQELVHNDVENLGSALLRKTLRIAIGREVDIGIHSREALELMLSILYAMFISTLYSFEKTVEIQEDEDMVTLAPQMLVETITV